MSIVNITTESDADFVRGFIYKTTPSNTPIDLTGNTMKMGIRKRAVDATEALLLTTENGGITITDAAAGAFTITIPKDQLQRLPQGQFVHSLIRMFDGRHSRVWSGTLTNSVGPSR